MHFVIVILHDFKKYRYPVEYISVDKRTERFKVVAKNKTLIIESNRPFWRSKGLRQHRYELKIIDGDVWNKSFEEKIFEQIEVLVQNYLEMEYTDLFHFTIEQKSDPGKPNGHYELAAQKIYDSNEIEKWKVYNRHKPEQFIILRNNRPVVQKEKPFTYTFRWHKVEGVDLHEGWIRRISKHIEYYLQTTYYKK